MAKVYMAVYVYGVVQGVGFRYSTQQQAKKLKLTGYARNLDDGSVEIVACGELHRVDQLITWIKQGGPLTARVDKLLAEPCRVSEYLDFDIRY